MSKNRSARTQRRAEAHAERKETKKLIHDRERLFQLSPGGSRERPMPVPSASVIDLRVRSMSCPQCAGTFDIVRHRALDDLRAIDVRCQNCGVARIVWLEVVGIVGPN